MWAAGGLQQLRGCKVAANRHGLRYNRHPAQQLPCRWAGAGPITSNCTNRPAAGQLFAYA
jgi:hypothetical protein